MYKSIVRCSDMVSAKTGTCIAEMAKNGDSFSLGNCNVGYSLKNDAVDVRLSAVGSAPHFIILRWFENIPDGVKIMCDELERGYGNFEWRGMVPQRIMPWYFLCDCGKKVCEYGVKVRPDAICSWRIDDDGISLWLDIRSGSENMKADNIDFCMASVVAVESDGDCFETARKLCGMMASEAVFPDSPVYGGNNWYYAYGHSSHEEIVKDAGFIAELSESNTNRPFMVVDDGWEKNWSERYNGGPWESGNERFPDMKKLADDIKALNVRPGLWFRPLLCSSEKIPESWKSSRDRTYLDPSNPEVLEYVSESVRRFAEWGYELIKFDFSTYDFYGSYGFSFNYQTAYDGWKLYDTGSNNAQVLKKFYRTVFEAAGRSLVMGCNCIGHLGVGSMHLCRIGDDTSGINWERTRRMGINSLAFRLPQHRIFFDIDADCIGITDRISWDLNKKWLQLLAMSGTPLFLSASGKSIDGEKRAELIKAFGMASKQENKAVPVDWIYKVTPKQREIDNRLYKFDWYEKIGVSDMM